MTHTTMRNRTLLVLAFAAVAMVLSAGTANAALITGTTVQSSYTPYLAARPPSDAIDGNGLPGGNPALSGTHASANWGGNFLVKDTDGIPPGIWITVDLEDNYSIDQIHVWNYSEVTSRGMKNVEIYVSPDENEANLVKLVTGGTGAHHNALGGFLLPKADTVSRAGVDLGLTGLTNASLLDNVRLVKIINLDNYGDTLRTGLAEIQFGGGDPVIAMVWRTDEIADWAGADWTTDGGASWIAPVADMEMIVNSGTATVSTDVSGTAATSLDIARDALGGTVEIASAGTLAVAGGVTVGDGGTLNVNGALDMGGLDVVAGGRLMVGKDSLIKAPTASTIAVNGTIANDVAGVGHLGLDADANADEQDLTLGDGSTYEWTFGGAGVANENYIDVSGNITFGANFTINMNSGGFDDDIIAAGPGGLEVILFRADFIDTAFDIADIRKKITWERNGLNWIFDLDRISYDAAHTPDGRILSDDDDYDWEKPNIIYDREYLVLKNLRLDTVLGDVDGSGVVDIEDYNLFKALLGGTDPSADFNVDGIVNLLDFSIMRGNWGTGTELAPEVKDVPEPATMSLLAIGGLALLRRRRRK